MIFKNVSASMLKRKNTPRNTGCILGICEEEKNNRVKFMIYFKEKINKQQ